MLWVVVGLLVVVVGAVALVWWESEKVDVKREVVVHTKSDRSIRGVFVDEDRSSVWLADASYLHEAQATPVEGRIRVPKASVDFVQELA